jgi:hypothetical protein
MMHEFNKMNLFKKYFANTKFDLLFTKKKEENNTTKFEKESCSSFIDPEHLRQKDFLINVLK